jgi:Ca2+/Na+ antiporter
MSIVIYEMCVMCIVIYIYKLHVMSVVIYIYIYMYVYIYYWTGYEKKIVITLSREHPIGKQVAQHNITLSIQAMNKVCPCHW